MSDETTDPVVPKTTETAPATETAEEKGLLRDLQAERAKRQALQKNLDDIQKANDEAETARLAEQNKFKELYETANAKVAEYEPLIEAQKARDEARKTVLLEKIGEDADDFKGLDVPALEKVVEKLTKLSNPPKDPGKPGTSPTGEFGGFESAVDLSRAVARGVPGAREAWDKYQAMK